MQSLRLAWFSVIGLLVIGTVMILMNATSLYKGVPADIQPKEVQSSYNEWHAFSPQGGEFEVLLPSIPKNAQETLKDQRTGQMVLYNVYISEKGGSALFIIMKKTYPSIESRGDQKILLQNFLSDILSSNENTDLIASNDAEFRGHSALNYAFRNNQTYVEGIAFVVDKSLYALSYSTDIENTSLGDYQYFVDSFSLK